MADLPQNAVSSGTAPIALFTFARPDHTARTLEALAANQLARQSDLIIFQDGPRPDTDPAAHEETTRIAETATGFRSVRLVQREENLGLAGNLYSGVSEILAEQESVIVVEDDVVTAPHFLSFMNQALGRYRHTGEVWHISGWNYPIDHDGMDDAFLWRVMNCWGWATWADRWQHFALDREQIANRFDANMRQRFNLDGAHNFYGQIRDNLSGKRLTWAIFWYATIFLNGGLCLNPTRSLTQNIGHDGTGENCGPGRARQNMDPERHAFSFPEELNENALAVSRVRRELRQTGWRSRLRRILELVTP